MATKTFEELKQLAIQIRDEKTNKQNTATRIGTQMLEHINKLEQDYYDKTTTDEELKERDNKLTELEKISKNFLISSVFPSIKQSGKSVTIGDIVYLFNGDENIYINMASKTIDLSDIADGLEQTRYVVLLEIDRYATSTNTDNTDTYCRYVIAEGTLANLDSNKYYLILFYYDKNFKLYYGTAPVVNTSVKTLYVLDKNGGGDFITLNDVIDTVPSNSTVFVKCGEYDYTRVRFKKGINWIGENRDKVIFSHYTADYDDTPICDSGTFKNITFKAGDDGTIQDYPLHLAYSLHLDGMQIEDNVQFGAFFYNCKFVSYWNTCIGIGMKKDYIIELHDCELHYLGGAERENYETDYVCSCISMHNSAREPLGKGLLRIYGCRLRSSGNCCMTIDNKHPKDYPSEWEMIGNVLYSDIRGKNCVYVTNTLEYWDGEEFPTEYVLNSKMSFGNNIDFLNK